MSTPTTRKPAPANFAARQIEAFQSRPGPDDEVPAEIRHIAHPSFTSNELTGLWADHRVAVRNRDALLGGTRDWCEVFDAADLGRHGRHEAACELAASLAAETADFILHGRNHAAPVNRRRAA